MDNIIGTVAEKAGISETQAKLAVSAVIDRLDDKLPGPIAGQIKSALGVDNAGMMGSAASSAMGAMGLGGSDDDEEGEGGGGAMGNLGGMAKDFLG